MDINSNQRTKITIYLAVIILLSGSIGAVSSPSFTGKVVHVQNLDDALNNLDKAKDNYNAGADNLPSFFTNLFGNEVIKLNIERRNETNETLIIKTDSGRVVAINDVEEEPTLEVWFNEDTFDDLIRSEDQLESIKNGLNNGDIKYEAFKFSTKIKTGLGRIFFNVRSWFG